MRKEQVPFGVALAEALFFVAILAIPIGLFALRFQHAQELATELSEDLSTERQRSAGSRKGD